MGARETDLGSIDYSALLYPVDPAEVAAFEAETSSRGPRWIPRWGSEGALVPLILIAVFFIGGPLLVIGGAALFAPSGNWWPLIAVAPVCASFIALVCYFLIPSLQNPRRGFGWEQHYRLSRFAWDNGLNYSTESYKPTYKGVLFYNLPAIVYNHLTPKTGRFFDIGNIRYGQPGSTDHAITEIGNRGFLAVHLGGALPHIILDAKANDGTMGGIGQQLADQTTFRLEGDFSEHFTLYCPTGYERDALYILTPDLMADLIDESLPFDVELVGEWMFVYAMKPFNSVDPATYERLFRIVRTVGARATRRSTGYRDDQYSSPEAAAAKPHGSRMRVKPALRLLLLCLAVLLGAWWVPISWGYASLFAPH